MIDVEECPIAQPELNELWAKVRKATERIPAEQLPFVVLRRTSSGELATLLSATDPTALRAVGSEWSLSDSLYVRSIKCRFRANANHDCGSKTYPDYGTNFREQH